MTVIVHKCLFPGPDGTQNFFATLTTLAVCFFAVLSSSVNLESFMGKTFLVTLGTGFLTSWLPNSLVHSPAVSVCISFLLLSCYCHPLSLRFMILKFDLKLVFARQKGRGQHAAFRGEG